MATILIVDDNPAGRELLVTMLGYAGHRLLEAGDGEAALQLAEANQQSQTGYALSLSLGTIQVDLDSVSAIEELLSHADAVMYADRQRKKKGK